MTELTELANAIKDLEKTQKNTNKALDSGISIKKEVGKQLADAMLGSGLIKPFTDAFMSLPGVSVLTSVGKTLGKSFLDKRKAKKEQALLAKQLGISQKEFKLFREKKILQDKEEKVASTLEQAAQSLLGYSAEQIKLGGAKKGLRDEEKQRKLLQQQEKQTNEQKKQNTIIKKQHEEQKKFQKRQERAFLIMRVVAISNLLLSLWNQMKGMFSLGKDGGGPLVLGTGDGKDGGKKGGVKGGVPPGRTKNIFTTGFKFLGKGLGIAYLGILGMNAVRDAMDAWTNANWTESKVFNALSAAFFTKDSGNVAKTAVAALGGGLTIGMLAPFLGLGPVGIAIAALTGAALFATSSYFSSQDVAQIMHRALGHLPGLDDIADDLANASGKMLAVVKGDLALTDPKQESVRPDHIAAMDERGPPVTAKQLLAATGEHYGRLAATADQQNAAQLRQERNERRQKYESERLSKRVALFTAGGNWYQNLFRQSVEDMLDERRTAREDIREKHIRLKKIEDRKKEVEDNYRTSIRSSHAGGALRIPAYADLAAPSFNFEMPKFLKDMRHSAPVVIGEFIVKVGAHIATEIGKSIYDATTESIQAGLNEMTTDGDDLNRKSLQLQHRLGYNPFDFSLTGGPNPNLLHLVRELTRQQNQGSSYRASIITSDTIGPNDILLKTLRESG